MQFTDQAAQFFGLREQLSKGAVAGRIHPVAQSGAGIFPHASFFPDARSALDPEAVRRGARPCSDHVARPARDTGNGGSLSGPLGAAFASGHGLTH